ncbi:unnamed protein product [Mytilus coruscus]|uniref:Nuclease HARBI1 n=1 Tax=Mytilus coruscus TaxID=42192 RepID=A0A6J8EHT0_MYTCO|nr:unnamed protein product [Mytilus coruscus]
MAAVHVRRLRTHRRRRNLPRPRVFRDRLNPLESLDDEELFDKYRFRRPTITFILNGIHHFLHRETRRNFALSPVIQLLLFLRFVATGTHLSLVGESLCISESATGRACRDVCQAIITVFRNVICFPVGEKAIQVMEGFRRIAGKNLSSISMYLVIVSHSNFPSNRTTFWCFTNTSKPVDAHDHYD